MSASCLTDRCSTLRSLWISVICLGVVGYEAAFGAEQHLTGRDTLDTTPVAGDVGEMLGGLRWKPAEFHITVSDGEHPNSPRILRFPSPVDTGDPLNDQVALVWHRPADDDGTPRPAIVVVHESGSAMPIGKLFATSLAARGVHTFLIHLPHYGLRRKGGERPSGEKFLLTMRQSIADVRRARDAVAALPEVDARRIGLQGTSLGGFVSATVAGLDQAYDAVYIMLAGGDLVGLLQNGQKEAAELRRRLETAGFVGPRLAELLHAIEPTRLAPRMAADRVWLYSAEQDTVVPLANALALKTAAGLDDSHHLRLWGNHTSTIVFFPAIIQHVIEHLPGEVTPTAP